jgi:tetratricopeptide (TPR) repeat protein
MRPEFLNDEMRGLYSEGKLSRIVTRCQEILNELRAIHGDQNPEIASVLDELARAHFELGDYEAAIDVTKQLLEMDSIIGMKKSADFARSISNLGLLYIYVGRLGEAELALESALELTRRLPTNEQWVIPGVLINLASVYRRGRDFARAERVLIEALKLRLENHGWWDPKYGDVFLHLSYLYWKMGRPSAAERALDKAMRIYQDASHTETTEYSAMLAIHGDMLASQSKSDDARKSYYSALEILRRVRPEAHIQAEKIKRRIAQLGVAT